MGKQKTGRNCDEEEGENRENGEKPGSPGRSVKSSHVRSRRSSSSSSSSSISLPPPPDGGWGWMVVLASFTAHLISDGCAFSFGVFYTEFLDVFGETKGKTAVIGALFLAVPLITGPIASALTNRYGCRKICMVGGVLAGFGFVLSSFVHSIGALCFTFGVLAGFGLSMVYVPAIVVVAFYFEKRRAFATGLAVAGTGIGTFVFAPLTEFLIQQYEWRGATLIIGGLMFNIAVAGAIFRPLTSPKIERQRRKFLENQNKFTRLSSKFGSFDKNSRNYFTEGNTNGKGWLKSEEVDKLMYEPVTQSLMHFPTFMKQQLDPLYPNSIEAITQAGKDGKTLHEVLIMHGLLDKFYHYHSLNDVGAPNGSTASRQTERTTGPNKMGHPKDRVQHSLSNENAVLASEGFLQLPLKPKRKVSKNTRADFDQLLPMYRKDIFYRGSLMRTRPFTTGKAASCPNIAMNYEQESSDSESDLFHRFRVCNCLRLSRVMKNTFKRMLHFSIFRSVVFLYFCLSTFFLYLAYDVPYVFAPDKAIEMGVSVSNASFLVSLIGISSTFGQITLGWVGDFPKVNAIHLYNVITAIAGIVTFIVPWMHSYTQLCILAIAYGFFISANYALTTIILVQLLGMDRLTNAYGIVMLAEGIANLIGPPVAGFLCDYTGDYDLTFFIAGVLIFVSGVMLVVIPCLAKCDKVSDYYHTDEKDDVDSDGGEDETNTKSTPIDSHKNPEDEMLNIDAIMPTVRINDGCSESVA